MSHESMRRLVEVRIHCQPPPYSLGGLESASRGAEGMLAMDLEIVSGESTVTT